MPIMKMEAPDIGFGFQWVPDTQALYIIHANGVIHEQIAEKVTTPEAAHLLAGMWCRGYRSRMREIQRVPGAKHHHMFAGMGRIGTDQVLQNTETVVKE
jgi:hypothetical protein